MSYLCIKSSCPLKTKEFKTLCYKNYLKVTKCLLIAPATCRKRESAVLYNRVLSVDGPVSAETCSGRRVVFL